MIAAAAITASAKRSKPVRSQIREAEDKSTSQHDQAFEAPLFPGAESLLSVLSRMPPIASAPAITAPQSDASSPKSVVKPSISNSSCDRSPELTPDELDAQVRRQATMLQKTYAPAALLQALELTGANVAVGELLLSDFRNEAGAPSDPVERLILDQIVFSSLRAFHLHAHAATAKTVEYQHALSAVATRVQIATCQLIETLCVYRSTQHKLQTRPKARRSRKQK